MFVGHPVFYKKGAASDYWVAGTVVGVEKPSRFNSPRIIIKTAAGNIDNKGVKLDGTDVKKVRIDEFVCMPLLC